MNIDGALQSLPETGETGAIPEGIAAALARASQFGIAADAGLDEPGHLLRCGHAVHARCLEAAEFFRANEPAGEMSG